MDNYEIYNKLYKKYSNTFGYTGGIRYQFYLIKTLLKYINNKDINTILDIGAGEGSKTYLLSECFNNSKVLGIDFTEEGINLAKNKYKKSNLYFEKLDVFNINEKETSYDIVSCFEVLEHVEDWQTLLKKIANLSNRYILISVPTGRMREYEVQVGHLRNFQKGEIENFIKLNGFNVVKVFYAGFPFYSPLGRDWLDRNFNRYNKSITGTFTSKQKIFHMLLYILFRFFSLTSIGDAFYGLFEIDSITTNSNGGGGVVIIVSYSL